MQDGTVKECATTITIPKDILFGIKYPHIGTAQERRDAFRSKRDGTKKVDAIDEAEEPEQELRNDPAFELLKPKQLK